jgi:hypothetical protein
VLDHVLDLMMSTEESDHPIWQGRNITKAVATIYILCNRMSFDFQSRRTKNDKNKDSSNNVVAPPPPRHSRRDVFELPVSTSVSKTLGSALCCGVCFDTFVGDRKDRSRSSTTVQQGEAFDIVMVHNDEGKLFQNSDFLVSFSNSLKDGRKRHHNIVLELEHYPNQGQTNICGRQPTDTAKAWFPIVHTSKDQSSDGYGNPNSNDFVEERFWGCCHPSAGNAIPGRLSSRNGSSTTANSTRIEKEEPASESEDPTSSLLPFLQPGRNPIRYLLLDDTRVVAVASANLYLWKHTDSVIVSDIDGTITKSNVRGLIDTVVTDSYKHCHVGICTFLSRLASQQIYPGSTTRIVYVTSRLLGLANQTRNFLNDLRQGDARLPEGPLLGFGGSFSQFVVMEIMSKSTHHFKSEMLWRQVVQPFQRGRETSRNGMDSQSCTNTTVKTNVLVAGFGNSWTDVKAYHMVGIKLSRIFKVNEHSQIVAFDRQPEVGDNEEDDDNEFAKLKATTKVPGTTVTDQDDRIGVFSVPPKSWYKDRRGSVFGGYTDPELFVTSLS